MTRAPVQQPVQQPVYHQPSSSPPRKSAADEPVETVVIAALVELVLLICEDMYLHGHKAPEDSNSYEVLKAYSESKKKK